MPKDSVKRKPGGTLTVRGKTIPFDIQIDTDPAYPSHRFIAVVDGQEILAEDLQKLRAKVVVAQRQAETPLNVEFCEFAGTWYEGNRYVKGTPEYPSIRYGVIHGVHASSGNLLARYSRRVALINGKLQEIPLKEKTEQRSRYGSHEFRVLTDAEAIELLKLREASDAADAALEAFTKVRKTDVSGRVREARAAVEKATLDAEAAAQPAQATK